MEAGAGARAAPLRFVEASVSKTDFVAFTCDMPGRSWLGLLDTDQHRLAIV